MRLLSGAQRTSGSVENQHLSRSQRGGIRRWSCFRIFPFPAEGDAVVTAAAHCFNVTVVSFFRFRWRERILGMDA